MNYYYKYRPKSKQTYSHQEEFVRQSLSAKRDGKRITVRLPKEFDKYIPQNVSDLVVKLLAQEFSKQRSVFENYTKEELEESISDIDL
jgi:hypothetical protein